LSASFSYLKGPRVFKIHREADVLHFLEVNSMCASLPGWTPALQSLPGLESKEVKRSSWEAGVYIVYVYIYIHNSVYGSQTDIPKTHTHTHRDFSFARWFDTLSKMQGHSFFAKGFECYRRYRWIVNAKVRFGHLL
jgi:hypothetical protein